MTKLATRTNPPRHTSNASPKRKRKQQPRKARQAGEPAIVIAADTTVLIDGHILEKPEDAADARRMLRLLSGRTHEVLTALAVTNIATGQESLHVEKTRVEIVTLIGRGNRKLHRHRRALR